MTGINESLGKIRTALGQFEESKHPRDHGKFSSKPGSQGEQEKEDHTKVKDMGEYDFSEPAGIKGLSDTDYDYSKPESSDEKKENERVKNAQKSWEISGDLGKFNTLMGIKGMTEGVAKKLVNSKFEHMNRPFRNKLVQAIESSIGKARYVHGKPSEKRTTNRQRMIEDARNYPSKAGDANLKAVGKKPYSMKDVGSRWDEHLSQQDRYKFLKNKLKWGHDEAVAASDNTWSFSDLDKDTQKQLHKLMSTPVEKGKYVAPSEKKAVQSFESNKPKSSGLSKDHISAIKKDMKANPQFYEETMSGLGGLDPSMSVDAKILGKIRKDLGGGTGKKYQKRNDEIDEMIIKELSKSQTSEYNNKVRKNKRNYFKNLPTDEEFWSRPENSKENNPTGKAPRGILSRSEWENKRSGKMEASMNNLKIANMKLQLSGNTK